MIKQLLKGVVIGIANIIPGVSGGTMAVSMGVYDKLIHALTHIVSEFKQSIKVITPIIVGALLGIIGLSFVIEYLFKNYPVQTNFLFIGLIVGGLPVIVKKLKSTGKKINMPRGVVMLLFFAVVVGMAVLGETEGNTADVSFGLINVIKLFAVGVVASATMVIPGVSGSMVLMLLGYYNAIIESITAFFKALFSFDVAGILTGFGILIPMGIGILLGIAVIAKLIEIIFVKAPDYAYCAIIGLIVASPVAIIVMSDFAAYSVISVLVGCVTFVAGYMIAMKLGEE